MLDEMSEYLSNRMPDKGARLNVGTHVRENARFVDRMSQYMSDRMPDRLSYKIADRMSDRIPEKCKIEYQTGMPGRMPDKMSDRNTRKKNTR